MFENLTDKLERSFKLLKGQGKITEINVAETLKEVRRALLDADVNFKIAKDFTTRIKDKAIGQQVITSLNPGQLMVKIVHDELVELMGGQSVDINLKGSPAVILMSGLQGSGKTTFTGKLANRLKTKQGKNPLLVACDVYRPAAIEQLRILGAAIQVNVYTDETTKDPVKIAKDAVREAKLKGNDVVIIDTAGRLQTKTNLMEELKKVKRVIQRVDPTAPHEVLLVLDATTGQNGLSQAAHFTEAVAVTGVVLAKLDGTAKGGIALAVSSTLGLPLLYVGTGEKVEDLIPFDPAAYVDALLS